MKQFEQDVEEYVLEMNEPPNFDNILQKFVTTDEELINAWIFITKDHNRKVCQRIIPFGQMSFKCYTCFSNSNYQICYECFDPQQHQNHQCLIFYDEKICVCGNTSISPQQAFTCQKHEELNPFNELEKIPEQLQLRLKNLIKAICKGYIKYISLIQQQLYKYDIIVLKYNHLSRQYDIKPIQNVIPDKCNMDNYMQQLHNAIILYQTMFQLFTWLIQQKFQFIYLITKTLRENLSSDSKQTILQKKTIFFLYCYFETVEDLFEYQIILDFQRSYYYKLAQFNEYDVLLCDENFTIVFQSINLKQFKKLWLINSYHSSQSLDKLISYFVQLKKSNYFLLTQSDHITMANDLLKYMEESQFHSDSIIEIYFRNFMKNDLQEEKMQAFLLEDKNFPILLKFNTEIWQKIQSCKCIDWFRIYENTSAQENLIFMFSFRWSEQIILNKLWKCLGGSATIFQNQLVSKEILQNFNCKDFIFTAYLESFANVKPIKINLSADQLIDQQFHYEDALIYQKYLGAALQSYIIGISDVMLSKKINIFCIFNYNLIKEKRNQDLNIDEELNIAYQRLVVGQQEIQIYERLLKIYLLLLKSSTFVDRVFTFILCYIFNEEQFNNPSEFIIYILAILDDDINIINQQFQQILSRCIQNLVSNQFNQEPAIRYIYSYPKKDQKISNLQSFDYAFIKMYIFVFNFNGFKDIQRIIESKFFLENIESDQKIPSNSSTFKRFIALNVLSSDICMYNVCGNMFNQLTRDLKLSFAKHICSIFQS